MTFRDGQYDVFKMFDKQWALAAVGTLEDFDGCTIGWGSLGSLWGLRSDGRLIVTIYVNPLRYTSEYLLKNDCFTVSFFEEKYRRDLLTLGTKSKRDCDKFAMTSLTPERHGQGVVFSEANLTFICRKLYWEQFNPDHIDPEVAREIYSDRPPHYQFIGEITEVLDKR